MSEINPYQPSLPGQQGVDEGSSTDEMVFEFLFSQKDLRRAESQYLLHFHPRRLLIGSLLLIGGSAILILSSAMFGLAPYTATVIVTSVVSSLVYLAMVHNSKLAIRRKLRDHGFVDGSACRIEVRDELVVVTGMKGAAQWPLKSVKIHRAMLGLILSLEPFLFVYIPKTAVVGKSDLQRLRELQRAATDR